MSELSGLINTHSGHNTKLKDENKAMSDKLAELVAQYEAREAKFRDLQVSL